MNQTENLHINYWGAQDLSYDNPKKARSFKKKLSIVICFTLILAMIPTLIYGYGRLNNQAPKLSSVNIPVLTPSPTPNITPAQTKKAANQDTVIKGDSYWRVSKRNCGTGKYYLSIQDQNDGKALHQGENLIINCSL